MKNALIKLFLAGSMVIMAACSSFLAENEETKSLLRQGQMSQALSELKKKSEVEGKDQLLYMLDYAMALQISGQYKESANAFIRADKLIDEKDYHSVSQVVGSALGSEEMIQYKGEAYEKFLINSMNAINYLMLNQHDEALVECRRINSKIQDFKNSGRETYEFSPFAHYLSAIIWEADKKYDDAYIEYEAAYKLDPMIAGIGEDLLRISKLSQRDQAYAKWKKEFKDLPTDTHKKDGEVIVIFQQGFGAKKIPRRDEPRFPTLQTEFLKTSIAEVHLTAEKTFYKEKTRTVYDVDQISMITLNKDYSSLVARRLGGVAAKAVVSDQIRQKNELLGSLAWVAMNIADRADLRQWSTLPSKIQVARIFVKPGKYDLKIQGLDSYDAPTADALSNQSIEVKAGKKVFVNFRSLR